MEIRQYTKEDYGLLCKWWQQHGWDNPVPAESLPGTGVVAVDNGVAIAAGFVYLHDVNMALLGYIVADPEHTRGGFAALRVINKLMEMAHQHVGDNGFVFAFASNPAHRKILERCGLNVGEQTTVYYKAFSPDAQVDHFKD